MNNHELEISRNPVGAGFTGVCIECLDPDFSSDGYSGYDTYFDYTESGIIEQFLNHLVEQGAA